MNREQYLKLIEPALRLVDSKGQDYNRNTIALHEYFPFGHKSYVQMIHLKATRLRSLVENAELAPNYDKIDDTLYDLLNYIVFYLERLEMNQKLKAINVNPSPRV
jgi:hypothetical protein